MWLGDYGQEVYSKNFDFSNKSFCCLKFSLQQQYIYINSLKGHHKFACKKFCLANSEIILSSAECNHYQLVQNGLKLPS